jgi:hypothetical protein
MHIWKIQIYTFGFEILRSDSEGTLLGCNAVQFGRTCSFHFQGRRVNQVKNRISLPPASVGFLSDIIFDPEDERDVFLRNTRLLPMTRHYNPSDRTIQVYIDLCGCFINGNTMHSKYAWHKYFPIYLYNAHSKLKIFFRIASEQNWLNISVRLHVILISS